MNIIYLIDFFKVHHIYYYYRNNLYYKLYSFVTTLLQSNYRFLFHKRTKTNMNEFSI